jgi:hypothetical protein
VRGGLVALIAVLATLVAVPIGIAATSSGNDGRGDVMGSPAGGSGQVDIVRGTASNSGGQITHKVTVAGSAANPSQDTHVPLIYIEAQTDAGNAECTFFVGRHRGRAGVYRCGTADRVGSARIVRTSGSALRYTFSARALGNPSTYEWAVITRSPGNGGPGAFTRYDRLPDGDDYYFEQKLR